MDIEAVQFVELCKGIFADSSFIDYFNERLEKVRNIIQSTLTTEVLEKQTDGDFDASLKE